MNKHVLLGISMLALSGSFDVSANEPAAPRACAGRDPYDSIATETERPGTEGATRDRGDTAGAEPRRRDADVIERNHGATPVDGHYARLVAVIQMNLNALGYDAGPIDGRMSPTTRTAIRNFQRHYGFCVDGRATQALAERIRRIGISSI